MADLKISQLTADTTPTFDDLVVTVDDPSGTPSNKKVTVAAISPFFGAATASVATSQTTTSTSYTDLATSGPATTVTIGNNGRALVCLAGRTNNSSNTGFMSYAVSGNSTVAADDETAIQNASTSNVPGSRVALLTGLTAGSNTFTAKYRVSGGTGTWSSRQISVIPL